MKEDYLWDGSGEPDAEVQELENLLGRYRHNQPRPAFDQLAVEQPRSRRWRFPVFRLSFSFAAVAAVLVIGVSTLLVLRFLRQFLPQHVHAAMQVHAHRSVGQP